MLPALCHCHSQHPSWVDSLVNAVPSVKALKPGAWACLDTASWKSPAHAEMTVGTPELNAYKQNLLTAITVMPDMSRGGFLMVQELGQ